MLLYAQFFRSHDFDLQWCFNEVWIVCTPCSLKSFQLISGCLIHSVDWVNKIIKWRAQNEKKRQRRQDSMGPWKKSLLFQIHSFHSKCVNIVFMSLLGASSKYCVIGSIGSFGMKQFINVTYHHIVLFDTIKVYETIFCNIHIAKSTTIPWHFFSLSFNSIRNEKPT